MQHGKIVTLSGISGIGKSFLKNYLLSNNSNFVSLISVTTRSKRLNEVEGIDKFFVTFEDFEKQNNSGNLEVVNMVFGNWYAYKKSQIQLCNDGINLITELFYKNVYEFKNEFSNTISVYILPEEIERTKFELKSRGLEKKDAGVFVNPQGQKIEYPAKYILKLDEVGEEGIEERCFKVALDSTFVPKIINTKIYDEVTIQFDIQFSKNGATTLIPEDIKTLTK